MKNKITNKNEKIFTMDVEKRIDNGVKFAKLLIKKQVIGEFYICGYLVEKYPEKVKQIEKLGHIIGGHGYYHEDFAKLNYRKAKKIIKKTIDVFNKHRIKIVGWRFPGLSFRNNQLKILVKYGLFDSSIQEKQLKKWNKLIYIRNWLKNLKKGVLSYPKTFPKDLIEKPWHYADLNEKKIKNLKNRNGRLIYHCYKLNEDKI